MVFEDVTALELHFHTGEPDPTAPPSHGETTVEESDVSSSARSPLPLAIAAVIVSVVVSVLVALLVRRFRSRDDEADC